MSPSDADAAARRREIVTLVTIGDHAELPAAGYLSNQSMLEVYLKADDEITAVDYAADFETAVVGTIFASAAVGRVPMKPCAAEYSPGRNRASRRQP